MIRALALLLLTGCLPAFPEDLPGGTGPTGPTGAADADGDGFSIDEGDCDDTDDLVYPGANERCDGVDNDCDLTVDDDAIDASVFFTDGDSDGFGNGNSPVEACDQPPDASTVSGDCDDSRSDVNPDEPEVCDGIDNNCDATTDDDAIDRTTWYRDLDVDGYGDDDVSVEACDQPLEHVAVDGDCNDLAADVNPDGAEVCGGEDEDCDGLEDDADPSVSGQTIWYADDDGDGFGDDDDAGVAACDAPPDTSAVQGDCDDDDEDFNPNADESDCSDPADYNCDGSTGFANLDADGFAACEECDDGNPDANPGEVERCDAANVDEDCDAGADDADPQGAELGLVNSFPDLDGDGFGRDGAAATPVCDIVAGISANDADCDDTDDAVSPDAIEICDPADVDEDCSGAADDGDPAAAGEFAFYRDNDGDGFGNGALAPIFQCDAEPGLSALDTDCDDTRDFVNPGAPEICDVVDRDEDCDLFGDDADPQGPDENATTFYEDDDGDGFGRDATARDGCDPIGNEIETPGDCDDTAAGVNPGEAEVCDVADTDEDCDAAADDADPGGALGESAYHDDDDGDGFGDESDPARTACDPIGAEVADATDCDDTSAAAFPGALEVCNGQQDDCDVVWTSDDGIVTADGPAGVSDVSGAFGAGGPGAPGAYALPADSTVTVCPGTYYVALTAAGAADVVGFTGLAADVALSGGDAARVLTLTAGADVSLTDLTITEGSALNGGGVLVGAGALTADGVVFEANAATGNGGALQVGAGTATLVNNTFSGNTATLGGAIYLDGGAITADGDSVTGNDATTGGGGWYVAGGGSLDVFNVATTANTAPTGGGAYLEDGALDCAGLTGGFVSNVATLTGGGVELVAGTIVSTACDWAPGNTPDDVHTPLGSEFYGLNATFTCDVVTGCTP